MSPSDDRKQRATLTVRPAGLRKRERLDTRTVYMDQRCFRSSGAGSVDHACVELLNPGKGGTAKACVATGNTQLNVYHKLLSNPGMRYEDLGRDYYERQRDVRRQVAHHIGKLGALGFELTLCSIPGSRPRRNKPDASRLIHTAPQTLTGPDGHGRLPQRPANLHFSG